MTILLLIVSSFLVFSLIHGVLAGRGVHTLKKFAVGDKDFKTATLVATLITTEIGGEYLLIVFNSYYKIGLDSLSIIIYTYISTLMLSRWMIIRMQEFVEHFSIAESMGALFGNRVRIITALCSILWCAGMVGIELQCITTVMHAFLGIEGNLLLYTVLSILLYAMRGGIRAVTITDVIQFITCISFLLTLIYLVSRQIYNVKAISQLWDQDAISSLYTPKCNNVLLVRLFFVKIVLNTLSNIAAPAMIQRFYTASDVWQAKRAFTYAYGIISIFLGLIAILALFFRVCNPHLDPNTLIDYLLSFYPSDVMHGFVFIAILSLSISTADRCIHSASLLFTNDLAPFLKLPSDNKNQLIQAKVFIFITCIVALLLIFYQKDTENLILFIFSLYIPVVPLPFILAVLGFCPRTRSVLWGMGAGLITTVSFHYFGLDTYFDITYQRTQIIIAILMHLLFLSGSHCLYSTIDGKTIKKVGIKKRILSSATKQ